MSELDLMVQHGLTEADKVLLAPENIPVNGTFVSANTNRLYMVVAWEQAPDGTPVVILNQTEPGSVDLSAGKQTSRKLEKAFMVYKVPSPAGEDLSEDFGDPESLDDDFGDDLGGDGDMDADDVAVGESALEALKNEGDPSERIPLDEVKKNLGITTGEPEISEEGEEPEPDVEEEAADTTPEAEAETTPPNEPPPPPSEAPAAPSGGKKVTADDNLKSRPKQAAVFYCAQLNMTIHEAANYSVDQGLYTVVHESYSNIRRCASMLNTAGYGVWMENGGADPQKDHLYLSPDGVTRLGAEAGGMNNPKSEAEWTAERIRGIMDVSDPKDLPPPLREVLGGVLRDPDALMLTQNQLKAVTLIAYGLALLVAGK